MMTDPKGRARSLRVQDIGTRAVHYRQPLATSNLVDIDRLEAVYDALGPELRAVSP